MFEPRLEPLAPRPVFYKRFARHFLISISIIFGALSLGIAGYHAFAGLSWLDSLLNASMILSGMGPVDPIVQPAAKWFASFYALFSGIVFITTVGIIFAPVFHRFFHKFHLDLDSEHARRQKQQSPSPR